MPASAELCSTVMRHAICRRTLVESEDAMPVPLLLTFVSTLAFANDVGGADEGLRLVGVGLGALQMVAGALFWPPRSRVAGLRVRGERLLAGLLTLWGIHRIATQFVAAPTGSAAYLAVHAVFITLYFLSTFAVIIMVLERARSESERLHARLSEAERLATTGELAAGMAHE